jgi:DNA polymerase-3 subunit delta
MAAATKSKTTSAFHAVVGSDESEVKRTALELAGQLVSPDAGEFGRDIIDGAADNADQAVTRIHQAIEAVLTLPFFGGEKLVWLKNANFLADNVTGRSAGVLEALEKLSKTLASGLPENVKFLLSAPDIDKRRTFYKNLSKLGKVTVCDKLDSSRSGWEEEVAGVIRTRARERQLKFTGDALELFTLFTGGDSRQIDNELEKLDLFLGPRRREVTPADVRLLVPVSRQGVIFELGNAIAQRDLCHCIALLDQLLHQGESPIGILLVAIVPTVRNLLFVKDLMDRHRLPKPQMPFHFTATLNRLPESATRHLPRKKDGAINGYALGIAACQAHRFKLPELQEMLAACLQANVQLVSTQLDNRVVLSELLVKVAAAAK